MTLRDIIAQNENSIKSEREKRLKAQYEAELSALRGANQGDQEVMRGCPILDSCRFGLLLPPTKINSMCNTKSSWAGCPNILASLIAQQFKGDDVGKKKVAQQENGK